MFSFKDNHIRKTVLECFTPIRLIVIGILSCFTSYADHCFIGGSAGIGVLLIKAVLYFFFYALCICLLLNVSFSREREDDTPLLSSRKEMVILALVFSGVYLLYLIVYYPGLCGYDTLIQLWDLKSGFLPLPFDWIPGQTEVSALMNDHHPVFTTLLFHLFYELGSGLGNANLGMFLFCVLQILVSAGLFAWILRYMSNHGVTNGMIIACIVFYLFPFIAYYMICMMKDTVFSILFVAYFFVFIRTVFDQVEHIQTQKNINWILLALLSIGIALANKKGLYISTVSGLALLVNAGNRQERLKAITATAIPIVLITLVLGNIVFPAFDIYKGGPQESMGFAFQQTARTYIDHPESFSDSDRTVLSNVLVIDPDEIQNVYTPEKTDSIKDKYDYYATGKERRDFWLLWLKEGVRHPRSYLKTTLRVCGGFFAPQKIIGTYAEEDIHLSELDAFEHPKQREDVRNKTTEAFLWIEDNPFLTILFRDAIYIWWLPVIAAFILVIQGKKKRIFALVPIAANIVFLILGPICWTRYGLCQLYSIPLLVMILGLKNNAEETGLTEETIDDKQIMSTIEHGDRRYG